MFKLLKITSFKKAVSKLPVLWATFRSGGIKAVRSKIEIFVAAHTPQAIPAEAPAAASPAGAVPASMPPHWSEAQKYFNNGGISADSYVSFYEEDQDFSHLETDIKALAFYLPQFHTFPENDEWWGKGFTEWTNTRKAQPQYPSHYQPREPHDDIGYYDLSDWHTLQKQAELIKKHGLYGLCIYHYWFSGKRLMEKPVDLLLEHPEIDLKFCLCWANENWTRAWDGAEKHVLIAQKHINDDIDYIIDLKKYIMDPRYIRINGEPLVLVYRPGGLPDAEKTFARWREWALANGIGKIRIWVVRGCASSPESVMVKGADAEVEFPPAYTAPVNVLKEYDNHSQVMNYPSYVNEMLSGRSCTESYPHPVYRGAMLGWDCTPRRKVFHSWYGFSSQWYYRWLRYNIDYTRKHHARDERFIFINAWNEWAEGTYLEPDKLFGYTNLNTTSKALFDIPLEISGAYEDHYQAVANSPYFDPQAYGSIYNDVRDSGLDLCWHFQVAGWSEGRAPSYHFPNALYLFFNPDVRKGNLCSLIDFHRKALPSSYLTDLCKKFDALTRQTRERLKVELIVPQKPAPVRKRIAFKKNRKIAIHLHCYYTDMFQSICETLQAVDVKFDLLISLPEIRKDEKEKIEKQAVELLPKMQKCDIRITPNRGRDIAPFICTFGRDLLEYDYFCHIHTKKSLHTQAHACWASFIFKHLFGDREWFRKIYALLEKGAAVVYPPDFLMMREEPSGWGSNIEYAQQLLNKAGIDIDLAKEFPVIEFPQGSMFWGNVSAMEKMLSLDLKYEDFPPEPLGVDGSIAHAFERVFFIWAMNHPGKAYQVFYEDEKDMIERKRYLYTERKI